MTLDKFGHHISQHNFKTSLQKLKSFTYIPLVLNGKFDPDKNAYLIHDLGTHYIFPLKEATVTSIQSYPTVGWTALVNNTPRNLLGYILRDGDKLHFQKSKKTAETRLLIEFILKVPVYHETE
jgi:hypothetical protein